jgi:Uma2 family endonuclease
MASATLPTLDLDLSTAPGERYEIVDGQLVEKPPMAALETWLASRLLGLMFQFIDAHRLGTVVSEMLFLLDKSMNVRRRPDVAFVSASQWPPDRPIPSTEAWDIVPELAIEVISASNTADEVLNKLNEYFHAGVRLAWVVFPRQCQIYVYTSMTDVRILGIDGILDGGSILPDFRLPVRTLFGAAAVGSAD